MAAILKKHLCTTGIITTVCQECAVMGRLNTIVLATHRLLVRSRVQDNDVTSVCLLL